MKITVIGAGYVGLAVTASLAELGYIVTCIDNDVEKIKLLRGGGIPIYEPLLQELVAQNLSQRTIEFGTDLGQAIKRSEVIFIAVGTPSNEEGGADLSAIYLVAQGIGQYLDSYKLIVNKSTGPVGTTNRIANIIFGELAERRQEDPGGSSALFDVVSNPEFLREGSAIYGFLYPDRIIIGTDSQRAIDLMLKLYQPIIMKSFVIDPQSPNNNSPETLSVSPQTGGVVPTLNTDARTAEMIKYASNAFLATKISFINEIGNICKYLGLDVYQIAKGIALDHRIAPHFLEAGLGFGGSCLPKDTRALISMAKTLDYEPHLLNAILEINRKQPSRMVALAKEKLGSLKGKRIGFLGLAFKKGTDDIRGSVAIPLVNELLKEGAIVSVYDPKAMPNARKLLKDKVLYEADAKDVIDNADCVFVITDWDKFKDKDLYKGKVVIDGRMVLAGNEREGIEYEGLCW